MILKYLDSLKRKNAVALTASRCEFIETDTEIQISGAIGAIKGDRLSRYVGFTGIEIPLDHLSFENYFKLSTEKIEFKINQIVMPGRSLTLSLHLKNAEEESFGLEQEILEGKKEMTFEYHFDQFKRTRRGVYTNSDQKIIAGDLKSVIIFSRRSCNKSDSTEPICFSFNLNKL